MSQKTIIAIIGVIVLILFGTILALYFTATDEVSQTTMTEPVVTKQPTPILQTKPNETVAGDWKTYENKEYGFMLKYPKDWKMFNRDVNVYGGILNLSFRSPENQKVIDQAQVETDEYSDNPNIVDVFYFNNDIEITIFNKKPIADNDPINKIIGEIILGGKKATEYWMGGYGSNYGLVVENEGIFFRFDFKGCKTDECIKNRELPSSIKQILKKFEFTNCNTDSDCEFVFTKMENSCQSCDYSSDDWMCMEKNSAESWWTKWSEQHSNIQCEMCLESNFKMFECKCQNNKCIKNRK
jgi:hypothetical protein